MYQYFLNSDLLSILHAQLGGILFIVVFNEIPNFIVFNVKFLIQSLYTSASSWCVRSVGLTYQ